MLRRLFLIAALTGFTLQGRTQAEDWPTPPYEKPKGFFGKYFGPVPKYEYTPEEKQLQAFWQAYYRSLAQYYASLDNIDWVAYYKKMGYPIDPRFYNPTGMVPGMNSILPIQPGMPSAVPTGKIDSNVIPASMSVPVDPSKKSPRR
jgi:hypothetical protein